MNKYDSIENLLYNYKMLKINIEIADNQLKELEKEDGMTGIAYDGIITSKTNKTGNPTSNIAERNITSEELILKRKEKLENKLNTLDRLIDGLNEIERQIIIKKYIDGLQWWQVGYSVKYSERWCKQLRTQAINKLVVGLYGE